MAYVVGEECVACGTCAEECPAQAIEEGEPFVISDEKCTDCGTCPEVCPVDPIVQKQGKALNQLSTKNGPGQNTAGPLNRQLIDFTNKRTF